VTHSRLAAALAIGAMLCGSTALVAHDISRSESTLAVHGRQIEATLTLNLLDFHELPNIDRNRDGSVSYEELDESITALYAAVRQHYRVRAPDAAVQTTVERYTFVGPNRIRLDLRYSFAAEITSIAVESTLDRITQPDHRHLTTITVGGAVQDAVLDAATPTVVFEAGRRAYLRTAWTLFRAGVGQVFTGYDHLALLVGLVIAAATVRSAIVIVTSFTIAYSITLALAAFDALLPPARLTGTLIAVSVGYVALENILSARPVARGWVAFLFGLIHGFGFGAVLRSLPLPRSSLALSLVPFNLGIDAGVLVVVAAVLPLILAVGDSPLRARILSAVSSGAACLSLYWFVQRGFLG
jgi:HupE / UreJ protein